MKMKIILKGFLLILIILMSSCVIVYDQNDRTQERDSDKSSEESFLNKVADKIFPIFFNHDTKYSPGYKEAVFQSLKTGMSQKEVKRLLGKPLLVRKWSNGEFIWHYSEHGEKYDHFYNRVLIFNQKGKLIEKYSEFYVD